MVAEVRDDRKVKEVPTIKIKAEWCKGCAICADFCPKKVFVMNGRLPVVVNAEACNRCMLCEIRCPDFALMVI